MKKIMLLPTILIFISSSPALEHPPKRKHSPDQELKSILNRSYTTAQEIPSEQIKELIRAGANPDVISVGEPSMGITPLLFAIKYREPNLALFLLKHGANPNSFFPEGMSALHYAIRNAADEAATRQIVIDLIEHGANVNARNKIGLTILNTAALVGHPAYVELLLSEGALPCVRDMRGCTALGAARFQGNRESIQLLEKSQTMNRLA